jgi:hypothetical protein
MMKKKTGVRLLIGVVMLSVVISGGHLSPAAADSILPFDTRDHPVHLIASYYNAIALGDYTRAYGYWLEGHVPRGATPAQFAAGFADVQTVRVLARLPVRGGAAAGTAHVDVPIVVLTTLKSGGSQIFAGCFRTAHFNVPTGNPPVIDPNWYLDSASLLPASAVDFAQAASACTLTASFPTIQGIDNQFAPVDLISSYYDAIAAGDYTRAYNYWQGGVPNQTLAAFAQGFAGTGNIGVVVGLSMHMEGAAGSVYAETPVLLTATDYGVPQVFAGCMVARRANVPVGNALAPDPNWYLHSADFYAVSTFDAGLQQMWNMCPSVAGSNLTSAWAPS